MIMAKASGHRQLRLGTENVMKTSEPNFLVRKEW